VHGQAGSRHGMCAAACCGVVLGRCLSSARFLLSIPVSLVQVPRGAVRRVPLKQELSPEEILTLKGRAAAEVLAARKGRTASDVDSDDESLNGGGAGAGGKKKQTVEEILSDPAYASLRGVELPPELAMLEDESDEDTTELAGIAAGAVAGKGNRKNKAKKDKKKAATGAGGMDEDDDEEEPVDARAVLSNGAVLPDTFDDEDSDAEDEAAEQDDIAAKPDDIFLLAANTEDDYSSLEVYCYNTKEGSLFVHHDLTLPALPLCLAWMDYAGDTAATSMVAQCSNLSSAGVTADTFVGSYVAVGTFKSDIEIWNLDVMDPLEPALVLKGGKKGGSSSSSKKKAGKKGSSESGPSSADISGHTDAVMSLAWNRTHRHMLASGSADHTVKLWDMDGSGKVLHTYKHHLGKVQSVAWNPVEATILATASFDRTVAVVDAREGAGGKVARYALPADSEALAWNPHNPACFTASCEDGTLISYDARSPDKPLWKFKPHGNSAAVTSFSYSPLAKGFLATGSLDKTVRLFDCNTLTGPSSSPLCIAFKEMGIGQVFSVNFFPQSAFLLGAGGSKGMVAIWDVAADAGEVTPAASAASHAAKAGKQAEGSDAASTAAPAGGLIPAPGGGFLSTTAARFASNLADPATVPVCAVRPRVDGQLAGVVAASAASDSGAAAAAETAASTKA
jgi:periodic tryptophan protein 1